MVSIKSQLNQILLHIINNLTNISVSILKQRKYHDSLINTVLDNFTFLRLTSYTKYLI